MSLPTPLEIDRELSERHLRQFVKRAWKTVETSQFVDGWHIGAIAEHLEAVARGEIRRLLINMPPRHMKSLTCGVFFPAWVWAQNPDPYNIGHGLPIRPGTWMGAGTKFLTLSHKSDLAERDAYLARTVMESPWYQRHWGSRVSFTAGEDAKGRYRNSRMGARYTSSFGGGVLGEGGDIIVVDDPHPTAGVSQKQREEALVFWNETLQSRLNDPETGAFVVVMQRLHERDLAGHIMATEKDWDVLCLPEMAEKSHPVQVRSSIGFKDPRKPGEMLWPERISEQKHRERELAFGAYAAAGQLQQRPAPREGGLFKKSFFTFVDAAPRGGISVRRWDLAATVAEQGDPDWTVGVKMRKVNDTYYIEHAERLRGSPHEVYSTIRRVAEQDGHSTVIWIPQDPGAAGKIVARNLVGHLAPFVARVVRESSSKAERAAPFAAQCEAGNVVLVRGDWNTWFIDELALFPNGAHDDAVDASSGAFLALSSGAGTGIMEMKA